MEFVLPDTVTDMKHCEWNGETLLVVYSAVIYLMVVAAHITGTDAISTSRQCASGHLSCQQSRPSSRFGLQLRPAQLYRLAKTEGNLQRNLALPATTATLISGLSAMPVDISAHVSPKIESCIMMMCI